VSDTTNKPRSRPDHKSTIVPCRLRAAELAALDDIRTRVNGGEVNRSEMIRLLIIREHVKRTTGEQANVTGGMYYSDFRSGRPSETNGPLPLPPPGRKRKAKPAAAT
jgi:hypothetical protein